MAQRLRLEQFEHSNKSGKFLANQLKTNKEKSTINSIKDSAGNIIHEPNAINDTFRNFYRTLYSSQLDPSDSDIQKFLDNINLSKLNEEQVMALDSSLTVAELYEALKHITCNNSPFSPPRRHLTDALGSIWTCFNI